MKKLRWFCAIVGVGAFLTDSSARATDWTLLLVPVRYSVLQVSFDVAQKRPVVLVSYQEMGGGLEPRLHVWSGFEWLPIARRDLAELRFLQVIPRRVIAVGDAATLPMSILEATAWCSDVIRIEEMDTPSLINAFGKLWQFNREEWEWFAARYRLAVNDVNAPLRSRSWYEHPDSPPPRPRLPLFRRNRPAAGMGERPPQVNAPPLRVEEDLGRSEDGPSMPMEQETTGEEKPTATLPKTAVPSSAEETPLVVEPAGRSIEPSAGIK